MPQRVVADAGPGCRIQTAPHRMLRQIERRAADVRLAIDHVPQEFTERRYIEHQPSPFVERIIAETEPSRHSAQQF
jgi:hypothetical protein